MLNLTYLLSLSFFLLVSGYSVSFAEGDDDDYFEEEVIEESVEEPAAETEQPSNDVTALRAQLASLQHKVQHLESQVKKRGSQASDVMPVNGPKKSQSMDPDVQDVMKEIGVQDEKGLEEAFDAHSPEEAQAMAKAHKNAKKLPQGETQSDFDKLKGLYAETIAESKNSSAFNTKANTFKVECDRYIQNHSEDSSSRSALYYLGSVLLKQHKLKDALTAFARVYRGDEKGPHAPDALLGMADVLLLQGNKSAAIKFLEKLKKDFKVEHLTSDSKSSFKEIAQRSGSKITIENEKQGAKELKVTTEQSAKKKSEDKSGASKSAKTAPQKSS